jgi:hypothetical protein
LPFKRLLKSSKWVRNRQISVLVLWTSPLIHSQHTFSVFAGSFSFYNVFLVQFIKQFEYVILFLRFQILLFIEHFFLHENMNEITKEFENKTTKLDAFSTLDPRGHSTENNETICER